MPTPLPKGFSLSTVNAGFRHTNPDLSIVISKTPCAAAGVFTTNKFKAAPVLIAQEMLRVQPLAQAIVINTGQANACTGEKGLTNCRQTQKLVAAHFDLLPEHILPASTGVIGEQLRMNLWEKALPQLKNNLGKATVKDFATAIMTTDSFPKYTSEEIQLHGGTVTLTGFAKGAGMICPNMATMISTILCDVKIDPQLWQQLFEKTVEQTFNRATVDGDTSTNDTVFGLASGASDVEATQSDLPVLEKALTTVLGKLAYMLVQDGEGATKVMHIHVSGAKSTTDAEKAARTVGHSQLVKTAMYGKDANWGRIVAALGRCGADFAPNDVTVALCGVSLFAQGQPTPLDFDSLLEKPLQERDLYLEISLGSGTGEYTLLASDLTHKYIDINADYRS